ncbi:hypothetical protein ABT362_08515 [Nonomuraea rubra]|uniref:Trans-aconitate methyltransferase n=1 Tax=Nonomuraea rubra TaxID=46180 RepID=A0A7X0NRC4_9ACTN|nr:hypothetical protein [Nonomuraea rubra]MBB6548202.1 trans-aconitate methyltransferase [Nonomuraea rubra]
MRATFNRAADTYQDARPDYPPGLYADLLATTALEPPARLLEVGCGPGKATLPSEIRRRLAARPDGRLTRHWSAVLTVARCTG